MVEAEVLDGERNAVGQRELDPHLIRVVVPHILEEITAAAGHPFVVVSRHDDLQSRFGFKRCASSQGPTSLHSRFRLRWVADPLSPGLANSEPLGGHGKAV